MNLRWIISLIVIVLVGVLFYVNNDLNEETNSVPRVFPQELTFENILEGPYHNGQRRDYVIKDTSEWVELWNVTNEGFYPKPTAPNIDFSEEMVIAVFQGQFSTGGYSIKIVKIVEKENSLEVYVEEKSPPPNSLVTQAFSAPAHIVKIKRVDKEVIFAR